MSTLTLFEERFSTPLGEVVIWADDQDQIYALDWSDYTTRMRKLFQRQHPKKSYSVQPSSPRSCASKAAKAVQRYFDGELTALNTVPYTLGGTAFQQQVWQALSTIPCGSTWSYTQLAHAIQRPKAVRAVGSAIGANPISLIIPCHRVIGHNQQLIGYAGGLERKRWLLRHEGAL